MTRLRTRSTVLATAAAIPLALLVSAGAGGARSASEEGDPVLYLVKIHADWCRTCMRLQPLWARLGEECGDSAKLVLFDVTDRETVAHSAGEAAGLGLGKFFDAHKSKTGTIAVIDATTLEPVAVFEGETDFAKYQAVLTEERGACGT
jgi:hypothetical protein